jgi:hypothetical protein
MEFVADTVTIVRYFSKEAHIPARALQILRDADEGKHTIAISVMSLIEILYLSERRRIPDVSPERPCERALARPVWPDNASMLPGMDRPGCPGQKAPAIQVNCRVLQLHKGQSQTLGYPLFTTHHDGTQLKETGERKVNARALRSPEGVPQTCTTATNRRSPCAR